LTEPAIGSMQDPFSIARQLRQKLEPELRAERFAVLDWPAHVNIGDHAIALGAHYLLEKVLGARCVSSASQYGFKPETLESVPPEIPIFFHGGGNLGDIWPNHQQFRESVLQRFPGRRFILLPQAVHFQRQPELERASSLFRKHRNLCVFVRDGISYEKACAAFGMEKVRLAPDMAFALMDIMPRLIAALNVQPTADVLCLYRNDKEMKKRPRPNPQGAWISDWPIFHPRKIAKQFPMDAKAIAAAVDWPQITSWHGGVTSWCYFLAGVEFILKSRHVITDRLHGHILATMCNRPNTLLANRYHKNRAFYETWTAGLPGVRFEGPEQIS